MKRASSVVFKENEAKKPRLVPAQQISPVIIELETLVRALGCLRCAPDTRRSGI